MEAIGQLAAAWLTASTCFWSCRIARSSSAGAPQGDQKRRMSANYSDWRIARSHLAPHLQPPPACQPKAIDLNEVIANIEKMRRPSARMSTS
jgi:hypothetical protein